MMTKMKSPRWAQIKAIMVLPLLSILLLAFSNHKSALQPNGNTSSVANKMESFPLATEGDSVFMVVGQMPEFPGGADAMMKFLWQNIKYPAEAFKKGVSGRVTLQFVVDRQGTIQNPKVLHGIGAGCDEEALRVVKLFPTWKPGYDKGKAVSVYFTLPIVFTLKDSKPEKPQTLNENETPLTMPEVMPEYPGGIDSMMRFLSRNIQYPKEAAKTNITGRVILQFVVDKHGKVIEPKIMRGIGGGCDEEAIRVVKLFPIWKPGYQDGKPVSVYFTLPLVFNLKD